LFVVQASPMRDHGGDYSTLLICMVINHIRHIRTYKMVGS